VQSRQEKAHNSNTIQKKSAETATKASAATASATRVPAWANAWDNNLPASLSLDDSTLIRQDASANVPLAPSLMAPMAPFIQRAPLDSAPAPTTTPATPAVNTQNTPTTATDQTTVDTAADSPITSPLIAEDDATDLKPGQMKRTEFLAALREDVCKTADEALTGTIWSSVGCPWVTYWFGYYGNRSSQQVEKAIRRYTLDAANVTSAKDYIPLISTRVRRAIATWATTGEVTGVPEGIPTKVPGTSPVPAPATAAATSTPASAASGASTKTGGVQLKSSGDSTGNTADPEAIRGQLGEGHSLDGSTQSRMGSAFGTDFSHVRVHTEASDAALSKDLNAKAFTVGDDIAFGPGEYRPGTPVGDALLAHELAHVMQQRGATASAPMSKPKDDAGYNALEADADRSAFGAIGTIWGGAKALSLNIAQNIIPGLQSGLKLQRCSTSSPKELTEEQKQQLFVEATKKQFSADIDKQVKNIDLDLRTSESKSLQLRMKAVEMKLVPQNVLDAWYIAQMLILTSGSFLRSGKSDDATKATIKKAIGDFYNAFETIVASFDVFKEKELVGKFSSRNVYENKYLDPRTRGRVYENLKDATSASDWLDVLSDFRMVSGAIDLIIASKFREQARKEEVGNFKDASQKAQAVVDMMKDALKRGTPDEATRLTTVQTLEALYTSFRKAVAPYDYEAKHGGKGMMYAETYIANPYYSGNLNGLKAARSEAEWLQVFADFEEVRKSIDQYIAAGPQVPGRSEEAETLVFQGGLARGVAALLEKHPQAEKIQAMFYPEIQKENLAQPNFQVKGIPLYFFLYREDDEWNLVDLTTPRQEKANSESGGTETKPPVEDLFGQLNSKLRFPKGILYWRMRDGTDWTMPTTEPTRISEWLSWIGLGAAAIGLTLATFGTGTVALVGAWFLAGSAVASGASAATDIVERSKQGMLDISTAIIDVSQIVASLASVGSFAAERIVTRALAAAEANAPFTGAKASIAALSQRLYFPLVGTRIAADTVSFIVMTDELFKQMVDIQASTTMDQRERDRLKTMILTRLAFGTGMMILNVKNATHDFDGNKRLVLEEWGNTRVALAGEVATIAHMTTPGMPSTTFTRTQFKLSSQEQVEYLLTNVKGLTGEQAEFLVTEMQRYKGSLVFGGSRVSGSPQTGPTGEVTSDLDVGFAGMSRNQFRKLMNDFNKRFTGSSQGPGRIIEHEWIFPGSKPRSVPEIVSPEEFFMRSGVRGPGDEAKAGQPFGPSGYLKLGSDGTVESGRP
jgi:hypothetical protein